MPSYTWQGAGVIDTHIRSDNPDTSYYFQVTLGIGESNLAVGRIYRALIRFPISIPPGETVVSAVLTVWRNAGQASNPPTIRVYGLKRDWHTTQAATWNRASASVMWQSPGASGADDRFQDHIGEISLTASESAGAAFDIPLSASFIQGIVDGTIQNNGFLLGTVSELNDCYLLNSTEYWTDTTLRPRLAVETIVSDPPQTVWPASVSSQFSVSSVLLFAGGVSVYPGSVSGLSSVLQPSVISGAAQIFPFHTQGESGVSWPLILPGGAIVEPAGVVLSGGVGAPLVIADGLQQPGHRAAGAFRGMFRGACI